MRYMRKTPVEAIQWKWDNQIEVAEFLYKATDAYATKDDGLGNLIIAYTSLKGRKLKAIVPKFGWVVRDGKTFQFYKDSTFRKTFYEVQEDGSKGIDWEGMNKNIEEAFDGFDEVFKGFKDVFGPKPSKKASGVLSTMVRLNNKGRLAKLIDDLYNGDDKTREEVKKQLSEGLKEMAGSDIRTTEIESVLDKMKELHGEKPSNDIVDVLTEAVKMCKDPFYIPINKDVCRDNDRKWREAMAEKCRESSGKGTESDTFESVLDEMKELHAKKDKDYGSAFHKSFEEFGATAVVVRLNDKMERVKSLVKNGKAEVKDESLLDSLKDMACYSVMLYVELKNKEND